MAEIKIIGTAHVSQKSVFEVQEGIETFHPDVVAVELDQGRYLGLKQKAAQPDVEQILEAKNFNQLLIQWVLAYIQRRIGMDVGVEPGAEMKAAITLAEERQIEIALIDRDIRITLQRFWSSMGIVEKLKMFYALAASLISTDTEDLDIEELKKEDMVNFAMEEFQKFSPNASKALITERDVYMTHELLKLSKTKERILVVIGAGHRKGIEGFLADPASLPPADRYAKPVRHPPWGKIFGGIVILLFLFLIGAIIFSGIGTEVLIEAIVWWILMHGLLTAAGTLLAGGHPLSAAVGFLVSPVTTLNPLIAAGWFAAIAEAKIRKPGIGDFKRIMEAETFKEMRSVPVFRIVLVAALANVGATLGTILYFLFIFPILGVDPVVIISEGFSNMWQFVTGLFQGLF
ncbi:MAG: TraB/GumN family protein [Methanospirillaceae archaeon]|nr:TraB/GumN family protein [Methanospirillaceae archaeon]